MEPWTQTFGCFYCYLIEIDRRRCVIIFCKNSFEPLFFDLWSLETRSPPCQDRHSLFHSFYSLDVSCDCSLSLCSIIALGRLRCHRKIYLSQSHHHLPLWLIFLEQLLEQVLPWEESWVIYSLVSICIQAWRRIQQNQLGFWRCRNTCQRLIASTWLS